MKIEPWQEGGESEVDLNWILTAYQNIPGGVLRSDRMQHSPHLTVTFLPGLHFRKVGNTVHLDPISPETKTPDAK